jgi:hypothetical protein
MVPRQVQSRSAIALSIVLGLVMACGSDLTTTPDETPGDPETPATADRVRIYPSTVTHPFALDTIHLEAAALYESGYAIPGKRLAWASSDTAVATVDSMGLVLTRSRGTVHVTAAVDGVSDTAVVTVDPGVPLLNTCMTCHWEDNPTHHLAWGFDSARCSSCHILDGEQHGDLAADHAAAAGGFDLVGAHGTLACVSCHVAGDTTLKYTPASDTDCIACHQSDYDTQHAAAGYPTTCTSCHTTDNWTGAIFDHDADYFPIFVSEHTNRWTACGDCHTDTDDFSQFTCFSCHAHNETSMSQQHSGVTGYEYQSASCYSCHPSG